MTHATDARRLLLSFRDAQSDSVVTDRQLDGQSEQAAIAVKRLGRGDVQILRDPVGTGKTAVALAAAGVMLLRGKADYVLIVAPNATVVGQWGDRATDMLGADAVRRGGPGRARWAKRKVLIVSAANDSVVPKNASPDPSRTLVIIDEAHRGMQDEENLSYRRTSAAAAGAMLLLVTATPYQLSAKGLGAMLRLGGAPAHDDRLVAYARSLGMALRRTPEGETPELDSADLRGLEDEATKALDRHLLPLTKVPTKPHPAVKEAIIDLGEWATAYSTARVLPELVGRGKNDAYQGGLTSCSEALWDERWAVGRHLAELRRDGPKEVKDVLEVLCERLGTGRDHPKVRATVDWVKGQVELGHHVVVFGRWHPTVDALGRALVDAGLAPDDVVAPGTGQLSKKSIDRFRDHKSEPVVFVLTDRFSESIDLDGGRPSLVHHDLSWNPVRLTQRWGRVVRIGTGFQPVPKSQIFVPVLDVEVDRRLWWVNQAREQLAKLMVPANVVGDAEMEAIAEAKLSSRR